MTGAYVQVGPFVDNSAPGIDHNFLNGVESDLKKSTGFVVLTIPYQFASGVTLSNGSAQTFTVTGHGTPTIPAGVSFVQVSCYWSGSTSGVYLQLYGTLISISDPSSYPLFGQSPGGSNQVACNGIVPVDGSGHIHALANSGNCNSFNASVTAYIF